MRFSTMLFFTIMLSISVCGWGEDNWVTFLGDSEDYKKLPGPELELVGRVWRFGVAPERDPEHGKWYCSLMIDHPQLPGAELRDCTDAWHKLYNNKEFQPSKVMIKAKLNHNRSMGKYPIVVAGYMRLLDKNEVDQTMWWNLNMPLLPIERDYFPISLIVACESISEADSEEGFNGIWHASQDFKVLEIMHGEAKTGQILHINYEYPMWDQSSAISKGQRVIWVFTSSNHVYGATTDTPKKREEARQLATRIKAMPVPIRKDLMDIDFRGTKVATNFEREAPELFIEEPDGSGKWVLRKEVKEIYSGPDGVVYFLPSSKVYFYKRDLYDRHGNKQSTYFGPDDHDRTLIKDK
jgi:hypothetical protein